MKVRALDKTEYEQEALPADNRCLLCGRAEHDGPCTDGPYLACYDIIGEGRTGFEYDPKAPCQCCGEPVVSASTGGTVICPWCDMGKCRHCGVQPMLLKEEIDGGRSLRDWREHMEWHRSSTGRKATS